MLKKITFDWLINELEELKSSDQIIISAGGLYEKIIIIAKEKIKNISFLEFFVVVTALRFLDDLIKRTKVAIPTDFHMIHRREMVVRPTISIDVDDVIKRFNIFCQNHFSRLERKIKVGAAPKNVHASLYLNILVNQFPHFEIPSLSYDATNDNPPKITERNGNAGFVKLVTPDVEKVIRYDEYALEEEEEKAIETSFPSIYTLDELVGRWGTNQKNVIAACLGSALFWVYINITSVMRLREFSDEKSISNIKNMISVGVVDSAYKYAFKRYVRLSKKTEMKVGYTLQHFYDSSVVEYEKPFPLYIWIDPPLCKRVLGIYTQYLDADNDLEPELCFLQGEIHAFEKTSDFQFLFPNALIMCAKPLIAKKEMGQEKLTTKKGSKREHALHELIKLQFNKSAKKSSIDVWKCIEKNKDQFEIIQEITPWSDRKPKITWISPNDHEQIMKRKTFQTLISRLKNPK